MTTENVEQLFAEAESRIANDHRVVRTEQPTDQQLKPSHGEDAAPNSVGRPGWANARTTSF